MAVAAAAITFAAAGLHPELQMELQLLIILLARLLITLMSGCISRMPVGKQPAIARTMRAHARTRPAVLSMQNVAYVPRHDYKVYHSNRIRTRNCQPTSQLVSWPVGQLANG